MREPREPRQAWLAACWVVLLGIVGMTSSACLDRELTPLNPCLITAVTRTVSIRNVDKIDLLFAVDNSESMREEQNALKEQFPKLISILTTGQRTPDDPAPFPPATDLHLGVVSSDMGAVGQADVPGCSSDGGDDGRLQHEPRGDIGCQARYPEFLSYIATRETPEQIATDFGCIATLGTEGCGYEQPLEAAFKALWPTVYLDTDNQPVTPNPYTFLGTTQGRGDLPAPEGSAGFLRSDPADGSSLLALVVVSDEEDCSSQDTSHLRVPTDSSDSLTRQGSQVRCFMNKDNLYAVSRYIEGFKRLRPNYPELVVFAAIVGVPPDLVSAQARASLNLTQSADRETYYKRILNDSRMQETVVGSQYPQTATMTTSCSREDSTGQVATAFPPRRIVEVARGFGANGVVQSICQDDFSPAMDAIIDVIAEQLSAVCLPRPLVRRADGLVDCQVIWELPPAGSTSIKVPTECSDRAFLHPVSSSHPAINERGGANCQVAQLAIATSAQVSGDTRIPEGAGWYYDDFSPEVTEHCSGDRRQRVSFTSAATPDTGVVIKLECVDATQRIAVLGDDVRTDVPQPDIGSPCGPETEPNGDDACVVQRISGSDRSMFCHPDKHVCVKSCVSATDCPAAWECDVRNQSVTVTGGRAFCVSPTCGSDSP